jgi:hypothetical protein
MINVEPYLPAIRSAVAAVERRNGLFRLAARVEEGRGDDIETMQAGIAAVERVLSEMFE